MTLHGAQSANSPAEFPLDKLRALHALADRINRSVSLDDIYLSSISNRVNLEVRILTVITTLFMPAALIAGIFGMNFRNMPLLESNEGFLIALSMMGAIALVMVTVFWRRRWLG